MKTTVQFLIRDLRVRRGLIYPSDLNDSNHYAIGSFYLMGLPGSLPEPKYNFHAVLGERIIVVALVIGEARWRYSAEVGQVGRFTFTTDEFDEPWEYTGRSEALRGFRVLRRLRSIEEMDLKVACLKDNFYFVGFSDMIPEAYAKNERGRLGDAGSRGKRQ